LLEGIFSRKNLVFFALKNVGWWALCNQSSLTAALNHHLLKLQSDLLIRTSYQTIQRVFFLPKRNILSFINFIIRARFDIIITLLSFRFISKCLLRLVNSLPELLQSAKSILFADFKVTISIKVPEVRNYFFNVGNTEGF